MQQIQMFKPYVNEKAVELLTETARSGWVGEGPKVKEFERQMQSILGCQYAIAVNSGTSALHLALLLAGVKSGDEVITTAQTMLATSTAIIMCGAKPVYADIEYSTGNLDYKDISRHITERTRAILAVDWGGYPCDWDEILSLSEKHGLYVVEDAAHALGAKYKGRNIGSICPATCFSFQAIKHLTTGDGGLLSLSNANDQEEAIRYRWFGIDRFKRKPSILGEPEWNVNTLGYKYQMNDIAAAIGLGNLVDFDFIMKRRHEIVARYREALEKVSGVRLFERSSERESADWLFSIHVEKREDFCRMMMSKGIMVSVVHLRIDRNSLCGGERSDLPELDRFTQTHISLPLHPYLTEADIEQVINAVTVGW